MGISMQDIPAIGDLAPAERRDLARWLRKPIVRGTTIQEAALEAALKSAGYLGQAVSVARLVALGWLIKDESGLSADTYERRIAAGAVDGARMSVEDAANLVVSVRTRIAKVKGTLGGVALLRAVLYGSAVRSHGNLKPDIGDLDLALEIEVQDEALALTLAQLPAEQQWRAAIVQSGWASALMQGDDRITLAGSLSRVLQLFNRQLNGLDIPDDGRMPCLITVWAREPGGGSLGRVPDLVATDEPETSACPAALTETLLYLEKTSLAEHERARRMTRAVNT